MSDSVSTLSAHPGTLSPRDINTRRYRVLQRLPDPRLPGPGEILEAWPWGEVFAHVRGCGPICRNGEIKEWAAQGLITPDLGQPTKPTEQPAVALELVEA